MSVDDSVIDNSTAKEEQEQQTSGDSSPMKLRIQDDDVEEKSALDIIDGEGETETAGSQEITVTNAVITGWRLNLVLVW